MTITEWFKIKGTYEQGLEILSAIPCVSPATISSLKHKNDSNFIVLKYELKKLENNSVYQKSISKKKLILKPVVCQKKEVLPNVESVTKTFGKDTIAMYPFELHDVYRERIDLFYKMCSLKIKLNEVEPDDNENALLIILEIESLQVRIDNHWKALNYWKENNRLMPTETKEDFTELKDMDLIRKKALLETSISKRKTTLEKLNTFLELNPDNQTKQNLYLRRTEDLQQLVINLDAVKKIIKDRSL